MLTLFSASLGDFSFDAIQKQYSVLGPILMILYLFVGAVMLLNLLIAILSAVYDRVQEGATKEFAFAKAQAVSMHGIYWNKKETSIPLPPPLNLITACLWPNSFLIDCYGAMHAMWFTPGEAGVWASNL